MKQTLLSVQLLQDQLGINGKFSIPNVPAGTYEIGIWSKKLTLKEKTTVTVTEGETAPVLIKTAN